MNLFTFLWPNEAAATRSDDEIASLVGRLVTVDVEDVPTTGRVVEASRPRVRGVTGAGIWLTLDLDIEPRHREVGGPPLRLPSG